MLFRMNNECQLVSGHLEEQITQCAFLKGGLTPTLPPEEKDLGKQAGPQGAAEKDLNTLLCPYRLNTFMLNSRE